MKQKKFTKLLLLLPVTSDKSTAKKKPTKPRPIFKH